VSPNPFRSGAAIDFVLGHDGPVDLAVYDVLGRAVRTLAHGPAAAGAQRIAWDGRRDDGHTAGAGVYFVRLKTAEGEWARMVVRVP